MNFLLILFITILRVLAVMLSFSQSHSDIKSCREQNLTFELFWTVLGLFGQFEQFEFMNFFYETESDIYTALGRLGSSL